MDQVLTQPALQQQSLGGSIYLGNLIDYSTVSLLRIPFLGIVEYLELKLRHFITAQ